MNNRITKEGAGYREDIGTICVTNYLPYVGKVVDVYVHGDDGQTYTVYEPASIAEARKRMQQVTSHIPKGTSEQEKRIDEAHEVTWQLCQQSWLDGIPADAKILCEAHLTLRPAHGSNRYDHLLLCNGCVGRVEQEIAKHCLFDVHAWVAEQAKYSHIHQCIDEAEAEGYKCFQLSESRWMEILPLYRFHRGTKLEPDQIHYPYPDMHPTFYEGWIRDDDQPGMETIYFTSRNKLFQYLLHGGNVEKED